MTPEIAQRERGRLLETFHFHRREARAAKRALDRLEADCARFGIRLVRTPVRAQGGRDSHDRDRNG